MKTSTLGFGLMLVPLLGMTQPALPLPPAPAPGPATPAATELGTPSIEFASTVHDFGKLAAGTVARCEFVFTNTGTGLLKIHNISVSCGCTTAGEWSREVEAGKTGTIPIQYTTGQFGGPFGKTVTVHCNDPAKPSVVLQVKGTVWKAVDIIPQFAMMYVNPETFPISSTIVRIVSNDDSPMEVFDLVSNNRMFAFDLRTNQPGKEYFLTVKTVPPFDPATAQGQITFKTTHSNAPVVNITTMVIMQPTVVVSPPTLTLGAFPLENPQTHTVSVHNNGTNRLVVTGAKVNGKDTSVQVRETQTGRAFAVHVQFPAGFTPSEGEPLEVSIQTNHPDFPLIKVPVMPMPRVAGPGPVPLPVPPPPTPPPGAK